MATTLDCELLRDLYGTAELRAVFDSRALAQAWLEVEAALAGAEADAGIVPEEAARRVAAEADASLYDLSHLRDGIAASKHPLVPLVRALADRCGEHGGWVHWGATTQDIVDTGLVLQVRAALGPIGRDLRRATVAAGLLASRYAESPMAGRTHGQHAVPITFGLKAATWADELARADERLAHAAEGALVAQLSGATGTLATLGDDAEAVQDAFCDRLGLGRVDVHWHATRDRLRDLGHALDQIAATVERIAAEIVRLEATELAEVFEPTTDTHVGSSTMPQKRNPMTCEYAIAGARLVRAATGAVAGAPAHAYERDMGMWAIEWLALPQAFILTGGAVDKLAHVLEGLEVDEQRMEVNLGLTGGQIMAEAVMIALARAIGHEQAHAHVLAASRTARGEGRPLLEVLANDPRVSAHLTRPELERLLEPVAYLGRAASSAQSVAARVARTP